MLPLAAKNTPSRFEQSVRRTRERLNPETMAARNAAAIEKRGTELAPEADGMAFVGAHVAAVVGVAIDDRLTTIARTLQCDGETRTLSELKADVFADILLDNHHVDNAAARHPAGQGDGPVHRFRSIRPTVLVTDPVTGVVLSFDRRRYRVPKDLRTWLRVRNGTCRFPGCNPSAGNSDIDHTDDWALGGPTNHDNLTHQHPLPNRPPNRNERRHLSSQGPGIGVPTIGGSSVPVFDSGRYSILVVTRCRQPVRCTAV
jgi:hypothetical protein